jgi:Xaa-Pro dipeptidase
MCPGGSSRLTSPSYAVFQKDAPCTLVTAALTAVNAANIENIDFCTYGNPGVDFSLLSAPATDIERKFLSLLREAPRSATATDGLIAALRNRGLAEAAIGIEMEGLPKEILVTLSEALPRTEFRNCTNLIRLIRAVKTPAEIGLLARAAEIAEQAALESLALAHTGGHAADLVQHFRSQIGRHGADFDHFSFSLNGMGICADLPYPFCASDVVFIDFGCIYSSYFSDTGTTLAFSQLRPEMAKRHSALQACIAAGARAMRPGVKASVVQKAMQQALAESGITDAFPHGHGMGLELRDYPILVPATGLRIKDDCIDIESDLPMEVGMVINLEAPLFLPTAGALQVEQSFIVRVEGNCELLFQDRSRPHIPA